MKHLLTKALLLLSSILYICSSGYAQTHYIEANSVAGVEVRQGGGSGSICPTSKSEFSSNNATQQFFFQSIDCSGTNYLKLQLFNNTTGSVKITILNQTGTSVIETRTLAPGTSSEIITLFVELTNFLWKFESSSATATYNNDVFAVDAGLAAIIYPKENDLVVPANTAYRVKAGQNITIGVLEQNVYDLESLFLKNTTTGTQTVQIEAYNTLNNNVLATTDLTITINAECALSIASITQNGANHEATITSNRNTKPYFWQVINSLGNVVKTGNTSVSNVTNIETIDMSNMPTGAYTLKIVSMSQNLCGEKTRSFNHVNNEDVCTMNASAVRSLNSYIVTLPNIAMVSGYDYVLKTPGDSVITSGIATGSTKSFDLSGRYDGTYTLFLKPNNSTKICSQTLNLVWRSVNNTNSRGYLKKYNNVNDFFEIAGAGDYGGVKDAGTGWVIRENKPVIVWQTYVKSLSDATTKAILTIREDSSSTARHLSVAVLNSKVQVIQRAIKGGQNVILVEGPGLNAPIWVRIERSGNVAVVKYSQSAPETDNPNWVTIDTYSTAFSGWKPVYFKGLYTTSANQSTLSSAEFHRFLGGPFTGTSAAQDNTPNNAPVLTASNLNPTANSSITIASSACKSGYLIQFYKNGLPIYQGNSYAVMVSYGDSYKAKCEKGTDKSAFSNTIAFNAPTNNQICGISDGLLLGQKTAYGTTYNMYARILGGKLWLTQSLGTTPESFLVRGVNILNADFVKSWTGNDYSCFEGQNTGFGGNVEPSGFSTPSGYYRTIQPDGAKIYTLGNEPIPVPEQNGEVIGGSTPTALFVNYTKSVPIENTNGKYNPDAFPTISVVNNADPVIGNKLFPNWSISWKVEGTNFSRSITNNKTPKVGIAFMFDMLPVPYGGYGQRCVDYIYPQNPNNGQVWQSDEACIGSQFNQYYANLGHTNANFSSALPFQERAGDGGGAGLDKISQWASISNLDFFYDQAVIGAERFGLRDWIGGKANVGLSDYDNEATHDDDKSLAILLGLSSKSMGYVFDQYANILSSVYIDPSQYPNDFDNPNSAYPAYTQLIDGSNGEPNNGGNGLRTNNVPVRGFWNPSYKISIPSKFSGQKGIADATNVLPSTEVSCIASATFRQGETYVYDNSGNTRVVNKFGLTANTQHMIARTIFAGETHKWYAVNRLSNRRVILQSKILCDQHTNGLLLDTNYPYYITNSTLENKHFDREASFAIGAFTAFSGCEWNIWDRNQANVNIDGYHGAFGIINLLNQRKTFGNVSKSFVDLKPTAKWLLWTSEISYDGGTTWVKDKANHYVMDSLKIPQRQIITPDGYWCGFLARPENTEATSCRLRVSYNNQYYYYTVTSDMWETVDYNHRNTPLSALPNDKKDYHYFLIKLGSSPTTEGASVNAPVINSNPNNPTAGSSVTFTATGCAGTVKWFLTDTQVGTGTSLAVASPTAGNSYNATCTVGTVTSSASNGILIGAAPVQSGVTITEPSKPQYYFSNGQPASYYAGNTNLPVIYRSNTRTVSNYGNRPVHPTIRMQSGYSMTEDIVWLQNNKVKFGINLLRGGQLAWASTVNATTNLIYNGYDGGFQVTLDAYQKKDGYSQNGKYSRQEFDEILQFSGDPNALNAVGKKIKINSYNTTMGGDFVNNSQSLLYYYRQGNSYIVGVRPIFYTIDSEFSQVIIETKYTLEPNEISLKIEHKYRSFRTDGQYPGGGFDGAAAPACFLVNTLSKYKVHDGDNLITGNLPVENYGQPILGVNTNKKYLCVYNPTTNASFGVYKIIAGQSAYAKLKQLEVNGSAGTEFGGGFTYVDFKDDFVASVVDNIPNIGNFEKTMVSYIMVGNNPTEIDTEASRLKILTGN
jgi:hypothetical protein